MDHNKLIEESANIFGRSLETPSTETPDLQEGKVGRVLRKFVGKNATAKAEKAARRAQAEKLVNLNRDPKAEAKAKAEAEAAKPQIDHGALLGLSQKGIEDQ